LILEFQVQDTFFGALKSAPKKLRINYLDLNKVEYERGWFKSRMNLKINNLSILTRFPGAKEGRISLKIGRKLKDAAEDIESYVNLRTAELKLDLLHK